MVGAGSIAESAARELLRDGAYRLNLVGFLDNDFFKHHMLVRGHLVLGGISDIARVYDETGFEEILIAQTDPAEEDLTALQSFARNHNVVLRRYITQMDSLSTARPQRVFGPLPSRVAVAMPNGDDGDLTAVRLNGERSNLPRIR